MGKIAFFYQVMTKATKEGLIFIEGTGPTYATATVSTIFYASVLFCFDIGIFL